MQKVDCGLWIGLWTVVIISKRLCSTCTKLEKTNVSCVFSGGDVDNVIVLSSDENQNEENKETVIKPGSEAKRKVRRRLLQSKEMTIAM